MKRVLLVFFILITGCSAEDKETEYYSLVLKDSCPETSSTVYSEFCVSEETYNEILQTWKELKSDTPCHTFSFTDLDGENVSGFFREGRTSKIPCDGELPDYLK